MGRWILVLERKGWKSDEELGLQHFRVRGVNLGGWMGWQGIAGGFRKGWRC